MITFRVSDPSLRPTYATRHSAGADLRAAHPVVLAPGKWAKVATGVWIDAVDWGRAPPGCVAELQVRARSGLALRHGVCLTNGVGTIDADYRDEICVLLSNLGTETVTFAVGDRIAQLVAMWVPRILDLPLSELERSGGFGSTGVGLERL